MPVWVQINVLALENLLLNSEILPKLAAKVRSDFPVPRRTFMSSAERTCAQSIAPMPSILVWLVVFLICLGLGYPTLNRYDPRNVNPDTENYYLLTTEGPQAVEGHVRFRVLLPVLARPFYLAARNHVGTWNPVFTGLLVANSLLTASTAFLLLRVASSQVDNYLVGLLGAAIYLLNFATPNSTAIGVDRFWEGFFLMAVVWSLFGKRLYLLPLCGVLGALAKETFVPFSIVFAATWWFVACRRGELRRNEGLWLILMGLAALITVTVLQSVISGQVIWPWAFASAMNSKSNYATNLVSSVLDRNFWYVYAWLLPLGVWHLGRLSRRWIWATAATVLCAFALNAYYEGQPGTVGRAMFSIAGPLLSLSVALLVAEKSGAPFTMRSTSAAGE